MGLLVDGVWQEDVSRTTNGRFVRPNTAYRNFVTPDGSPGSERQRRLPRRSRPLSSLCLAGLPVGAPHADLPQPEAAREVDLGFGRRSARWRDDGWEFGGERGGTPDSVNGKKTLCRRLYCGRSALHRPRDGAGAVGQEAAHHRQQRIVRHHPHVQLGVRRVHQRARPTITRPSCAARSTRINDLVYPTVNNGVYRAGFATSQDAYEEAARGLFATLDQLEERLSRQRYLAGDAITEADWRLFTTLVRFDAVYYSHFKCNLRRIADYPNLSNYLRDLYQVPGIAETVSLEQIKRHYYGSQRQVNPTGIVPIGPLLDFTLPHDRGRFA